MKKTILAFFLCITIFFCAFVENVYAQNTAPIDLVLVLDTSTAMSSSYENVNNYLSGDFLSEFLRVGDTFHLITFAGSTRLDSARRIAGSGDVETMIGRMLIQYPVETGSNVTGALSYAEQYVTTLPNRSKKIVLVTIGNQAVNGLVAASKQRLTSSNATIDYVQVTPGQRLTNLPTSDRTPTRTTPATQPAAPVQTPAVTQPTARPPASSTTTTAATPPASSTTTATTPPAASTTATTPSAVSTTAERQPSSSTTTTATTPPPAATTTTPPPASTSTAAATPPASTTTATQPPAATTTPAASAATRTATPPASSSTTATAPSAASTATTPPPASTNTAAATPPASTSAAAAVAALPTASETTGITTGAGGDDVSGLSSADDTASPDSTADTLSSTAGITESDKTKLAVSDKKETPAKPQTSSAAASQNKKSQSSKSFTSSLPFIIGLIILILLILGLIIFLLSRKLNTSPNRVMTSSSTPKEEPSGGTHDNLADFAAGQSRQRSTPYDDRITKDDSKAAVINPSGPLLLNLYVNDQNTSIGKRNIHSLKSGYSLTVGGGKSDDYFIFLVPVPAKLGEIRRDGSQLTFIPHKAKYFPDIGSNQVQDCINKTIRLISDKNYEMRFRFEMYEDPLIALNRLLHSVKVPG